MTRATLLHVLDHTTALGPAEVRELEQLAQAFPYCQTAHLLLAKAAHDQGTMLAGQRLRRAATYAADRTLLRRLIEQVAPAAVEPAATEEPILPQTAVATEAVAAVAIAVPAPSIVAVPSPAELAAAESEVLVSAVVPPTIEATPLTTVEPMPDVEAPVSTPVAEPVLVIVASVEIPDKLAEPVSAGTLTPEEALFEELSAPIEPETEPVSNVEEADNFIFLDQEGVDILAANTAPAIILTLETEAETEGDLPAQAPAIRPPVEVGEARFEFGLAETPPPLVPTYELPGLVDEWAAAAVTLSLGSKDPLPEFIALTSTNNTPGPAAFTPVAFTGDDTIGYGFGESSRLGFSMQLLSLLADSIETSEDTSALASVAQPPAAPLPPPGAFFEPDPLLLDHWATHYPPPPVLPSSLDLINNFLRRQPRLTRPAMLPPAANHQADLSVRSTRAEPDLVSENLARIFVRQGKTARAIEIYEKLMVKQPEKLAYFAAQIQQLQPPA